MSTFRASVTINEGVLHTSRPLLAPEPVRDLIDSVVYDVSQPERSGSFASVEVVIETPDESEHPIGDAALGTMSTPLASALDDDDDDEPAPSLAGQQ